MSPNKMFIVESEFLNLADSRIICLGAGEGYITKSQVRHSTGKMYVLRTPHRSKKNVLCFE